MNDAKYIGLDVHRATISVAVLDSADKVVMEAILETKAETILQFLHGQRGSLHATWEEGTCAAWLYDLLKPHVTESLGLAALRQQARRELFGEARKYGAMKFLQQIPSIGPHPRRSVDCFRSY